MGSSLRALADKLNTLELPSPKILWREESLPKVFFFRHQWLSG